MAIRCRVLLSALLITATLPAAAIELLTGRGIGAYHDVILARGMYDPWISCTPPYGCRDPVQLRLELERSLRMQELRERATQSEPRYPGPADGPWGLQHYIPPATPESNIQPAYRGASKLRPEYEHSGRPIGEPATESPK